MATSEALNRQGAPAVIVVWEPVMKTDRESPDAAARGRVRAQHFWDPGLVVAKTAQAVLKTDLTGFHGAERLVTGPVLWDYIGVYPPGVRWDDTFPRPQGAAAPVVDAVDAMLAALP